MWRYLTGLFVWGFIGIVVLGSWLFSVDGIGVLFAVLCITGTVVYFNRKESKQ